VDSLYCEVNEGYKAYAVGGLHRHTPEIEQELSLLAGEQLTITFTPHLVPMDRGILSTVYAMPLKSTSTKELQALYSDFTPANPLSGCCRRGVCRQRHSCEARTSATSRRLWMRAAAE